MIEGLRPYSDMATPGPDWLPSLPRHWELHRAKANFREVDERSARGDEELLSVSHKTGVTPRSQKNVTMFKAESYEGHKTCQPGDIVVNTLWAWMAALGASKHVGIVSPAYGVYRQRAAAFDPRYLDYLLRTETYRGEYLRSSRGITTSRLRLYPPDFLNIPLVQPPLDEQRLIVRFLDWNGTMTGKLIRAKRRLIALLNEQKQSIIHRAVTRGLDPTAKLKSSGVDWLGYVPEHWEVRRLKWVVRLQRGYDLPADQRVDGAYPVVSSGGVIGRHIEHRASAPGVVMGRYGSTDAVFFLDEDYWPHNTSLFVTDFQGNDPRWCFHMLRSISKADHSGKSAVPGVDRKDLYEIMIAVPPQGEQLCIASNIDDQCAEFDQSIELVKDEIALIHAFRTQLIADVVTGQFDVRAAAVSLPDVAQDETFADTSEDADDENEAALDPETEDA